MASPLNIFRKYQTQVMVTLLLVAMFTFVVGPIIADYLSRGMGRGSAADATVVSFKGGKLTESGLYNLRTNHHRLINFLDKVMEKARDSGGAPKANPISRAFGEEDLVMRVLKAKKAEQLGLVMSDETMMLYLEALADNAIERKQMNRVLNEATGGSLDERTMFMQLRTELLAQKLDSLALGELSDVREKYFRGEAPLAIPPSLAWDFFKRMHRRVKTEMYPMETADFLDKVKDDPTDAQIQKLYEDHKDDFADPSSAEPGFKRYNQVAFQYLRMDSGKILEEEKAKVTEEQIKEYYDKNKDVSYQELELPEKPVDKKADKDDKGKKPEENDPEKGKPGEKKPEDGKPEEKSDPEKPAKPEECQEEEPEKTAPKKDDPEKTEPKQEEPAKKPGEDDETPKEEPAKPKKKEIKYKPLDDKLKEEIRAIAAPLATAREQKIAKEIADQIREYSRDYRRWEAENKAKIKDPEPKPEPIDLKKLARSLGLQSGQTPLVNQLVMREDAKRDKPKYELSRTQFFDNQSFRSYSFADVAFGAGAPLYEVLSLELSSRAVETGRVRFFFWRTEETPAFVPPLKDARPAVVEAWKQKEALKHAENAARKLAESVAKSGKSIKESLPASQAARAFETDSFSWLSRNTPMGGGEQGISRIRKIGGSFDDEAVELVGDEFMEAVFALQPGECGVAVNHPKTIVCVVRLLEEPISEELLLRMFLDSTNKSEIYMLALRDRGKQLNDWQEELEKEMALKWERDPEVNERG